MIEFCLTLMSIIYMANSQKKLPKYRCGSDFINKEIIEIDSKPIDHNNPLYKRRLQDIDNDGFKNFNIFIDTTNLENQLKAFKLKNQTNLYINSITKVKETLQKLLKVKSLEIDFNLEDDDLTYYFGVNFWDKEKFGSEAKEKGINLFSLGIDLVIFPILEQMETNVIAAAAPIFVDRETGQPIAGLIYINKNLDYLTNNFEEFFQSTILHELTHVLGFSFRHFDIYLNNLLIKDNVFYVNSTKVIQVAKKYFNCSDIEGVALEDFGDSGTAGSHWEARILLGDYMNGYIFPEEQVISEFTLALLEDTGYYKANYYSGGLMRYGKNKGCEFLKNKCLNSDKETDPKFENEFFDSIHSDYSIDNSCSSGRQSRTYSILYYYNETNETELSGYKPADSCPIFRGDYSEQMINYYIGHCSSKGSGEYGMLIQNKDASYNISEEIELITGETYSDHSFCYLSSLIKNEDNQIFNYSGIVRAICFETFCSSKSLTVKIHNDYIVCPREGGKVQIENYDGYFLCPDYNLICSGTILCNNMFECIDKKSEIKEDSYIYDYQIKTSQSIDRAEEEAANNESNYELGIDGKCPQYCSYCTENECNKCKTGFFRVKKGTKIICLPKSEVEIGYYLKDSLYIECLENCKKCSNETICEECKFGFDNNNNNQCIEKIDNCEEYEDYHICKKCKKGYAFLEDQKNCINIKSFETYYSKDNGISYYLCDGEGEEHIANCKKCSYNGLLECNECLNEFILLDGEKNKCYSKEEINSEIIYYINNTHANTCSKIINNCISCENENICIKCEKNFYFLNNVTSKCYNISEINPIEEYYLDKEKTMYYSCKNIKFNSFPNCRNCSSNGTCSHCNSGFTFINGNKNKCVNINTLYGKYFLDPDDQTNYLSCASNCERCNEYSGICEICKENYGIFNYTENCTLLSNVFNNLNEYNMHFLGIEPNNGFLNLYILMDFHLPTDFRLTMPVIYNFSDNSPHHRNLQNLEEYNITFYPSTYNFEGKNIVFFDHVENLPYYDYDLSEIRLNLGKIKDNKKKNLNYKINSEHVEYFRAYQDSNLSKIKETKIYTITNISEGKKFTMMIKETIEIEKEITIKFKENENNNIIEANCFLSKKNENNIPCTFNEEININNYKMQDYLYINYTEGKIFLITMEKKNNPRVSEHSFDSTSSDEIRNAPIAKSSGNKISKGLIAIIIVCSVIFIAIVVFTVIIVIKKVKNKDKNKDDYKKENNNSNINTTNNVSEINNTYDSSQGK